jgi:hypothetical protein
LICYEVGKSAIDGRFQFVIEGVDVGGGDLQLCELLQKVVLTILAVLHKVAFEVDGQHTNY